MAGDQHHAFGLRWIGSAQNGVDIGHARGARNAPRPRLAAGGVGDERIAIHFQAAVALRGDLLELRFDPIRRGLRALPRRQIGVHAGERVARAKLYQRFNRLFYARGVDGLECPRDGRIGRRGLHRRGIAQKIGLRQARICSQNPYEEHQMLANVHGVFSGFWGSGCGADLALDLKTGSS